MSAPTYEGTTPLASDRYIVTAIAGEDLLTIGNVVEISDDWTVKASTLTTTPSNKVMGITLTAAKSGKRISVVCRGLARATAYGTINAGDTVAAGPGGTVQTIAQPTSDDCNTSAGTAAVISKMVAGLGKALVGAASGGTAYILLT
jgi:hypothetical protein